MELKQGKLLKGHNLASAYRERKEAKVEFRTSGNKNVKGPTKPGESKIVLVGCNYVGFDREGGARISKHQDRAWNVQQESSRRVGSFDGPTISRRERLCRQSNFDRDIFSATPIVGIEVPLREKLHQLRCHCLTNGDKKAWYFWQGLQRSFQDANYKRARH